MADDLSDQDIFDSTELQDAELPTSEPSEPGEQPRGPDGKFLSKAGEQKPQDEPQPQAIEQPATEESKPETAQSVPPGLLEERRRRQEAEQRANSIERQLAEMRGYLQGQQRQQEPPKQQEPPDFILNPEGFVDDRFQKYAQQFIQPLQSALRENTEYYSERLAEKEYGKETVGAARQWIETQVRAGDQEALAILHRSVQTRDPYGMLVQQYQQRQAIAQVGTDPNAWFEKTLETKLSDPSFQQALAAKLGPVPQGRPQSMPSINRASGSAATPNDNVPGTEEELFNTAPRRMGRRD